MRNVVIVLFGGLALAACGDATSEKSGWQSGGDDASTSDASAAGDDASTGDDAGGAGDGASTASDGSGGCGSGMTSCGGACVSTGSDSKNCGSCGHVCPSGESCQAGACVSGQTCPPPPSSAPAQAQAAIAKENDVRAKMGIPCASLVDALDTASAKHCTYYDANASSSTCVADPHTEVSTCTDYVAANFWDRDTAAGYTGQPEFEDMAFVGDGAQAVQSWIDTIWHRTPVLSPWARDVGYGGASGCDTMDFGVGATTPDTVTATYPYDGETGVPTSFDGTYEGPPPPAPPSGWPSGYPIHIYMRNGSVSTHTLTVKGSSTPIAHVWLTPADSQLLPEEYVMYANTPLTSGTTYHVHVDATQGGSPVTFDWSFTTQ